ncbi:MAG: glycoside hydrolase family 57 protein [Halobacteriota archaeon]|nr:glycoside hydrolase family 57 protein [Halobacteriota archaeon]
MVNVSLCFELHQPFRIRKEIAYNKSIASAKTEDLFDIYFDNEFNRSIFNKVSKKCYRPATEIIISEIDRYKKEKKKFKVSFSLSGIFIEQCEKYDSDLLDLFVQLNETGCAEFIGQTYYHSLASLYEDKEEYIDQISLHDRAIRDLFGYKPTFFENTELLFNNEIAALIYKLGYKGIFTEGVDWILGGRSPNFIYNPKDSKIKVLLRNYKLTDDVGFRFSAKDWEEYPLTADKYASWLSATPGQCINLFMDYETLGEHHWVDTGIHNFLSFLPGEIFKYDNLNFATPTEIVKRNKAVGEVDVGVYETISWADLERNTSCWLGNGMQRICYNLVKGFGGPVRASGDEELLRIWRYLQTSDHLYYIYTGGGASGDVHNYFSPYGDPVDGFVSFYALIKDFENRVCDLE